MHYMTMTAISLVFPKFQNSTSNPGSSNFVWLVRLVCTYGNLQVPPNFSQHMRTLYRVYLCSIACLELVLSCDPRWWSRALDSYRLFVCVSASHSIETLTMLALSKSQLLLGIWRKTFLIRRFYCVGKRAMALSLYASVWCLDYIQTEPDCRLYLPIINPRRACAPRVTVVVLFSLQEWTWTKCS